MLSVLLSEWHKSRKNSKDSRNVFSRPLHSVLKQSLVVEILKNAQASCQPIQQACLLQYTSLQKWHVEQVSWGHAEQPRITPALYMVITCSCLWRNRRNPKDGSESTRFYSWRMVYLKNSGRFRCTNERSESTQESVDGTVSKLVHQHVCFIALKQN